jgi:LysR family transcriptional regulator, regulator for metE and metH
MVETRMPLELRHFALVVAVAETGSLTAASRRLHVTPSALSHQLRDAEERLGTQLFQRRNRRLLLTGAGEIFLASARRVTSEVARAEAGCRSEAPSDLLRISTGCYTAYGWLPAILGRWQADHPRVELRIVLEATRRPIPSLLDGALDLALTTDAPSHPRLQHNRLFADELLAVLPAGHALARRTHVTAEDLADEHILTYDAPRDQLDMFTRVMWPAGVEPRRVSRVPLTEALLDLVRGGFGVTALPSWMLRRAGGGLRTVRITRRGIRRQWTAVRLATRAPPAPMARFIELLREEVTAKLATD